MLRKSFALTRLDQKRGAKIIRPQSLTQFIEILFLFLVMEFAHRLLLYISVTSLVFLLLGLYKPWVMLWWEDVQNRRKVIRLYGAISVSAIVVYAATSFLF
jgi:hypothetical protein